MFDPADVHDGAWRFWSYDPVLNLRKWFLDLGDGKFVIKTEYLANDELLEANAQDRAANDGKRWGDGQVVARIPLHHFYGELAQPIRDGDDAYVRRWLNDGQHAAFRTFGGRI